MSFFGRESDGLDRLRDAASALKRWRPPAQGRLRIERERIERAETSLRPSPRVPRPGGKPSDLAKAGYGVMGNGLVVPNPLQSQPGGRPRTVARPSEHGVAAGIGVTPPLRTNRTETLLRKLARRFPTLRRLLWRLDRLALAAKPWLSRVRRILHKHRGKLIWSFVIGSSLVIRLS